MPSGTEARGLRSDALPDALPGLPHWSLCPTPPRLRRSRAASGRQHTATGARPDDIPANPRALPRPPRPQPPERSTTAESRPFTPSPTAHGPRPPPSCCASSAGEWSNDHRRSIVAPSRRATRSASVISSPFSPLAPLRARPPTQGRPPFLRPPHAHRTLAPRDAKGRAHVTRSKNTAPSPSHPPSPPSPAPRRPLRRAGQGQRSQSGTAQVRRAHLRPGAPGPTSPPCAPLAVRLHLLSLRLLGVLTRPGPGGHGALRPPSSPPLAHEARATLTLTRRAVLHCSSWYRPRRAGFVSTSSASDTGAGRPGAGAPQLPTPAGRLNGACPRSAAGRHRHYSLNAPAAGPAGPTPSGPRATLGLPS